MRKLLLFVFMAISAAALLAQSAAPANVVAKIGDEEVTISDLENYSTDMPYLFKGSGNSQAFKQGRGAEGDKEARLEEIIQDRLVLKEAKGKGLEKDPDFLAKKKSLEDQLLLAIYYDKVVRASINPTDEELRAQYDQSMRFMRPATAKVIRVISQSQDQAKADANDLKAMKEGEITDQRFRVEEIHLPEEQKIGEMANSQGNRLSGSEEAKKDPHIQMMIALVGAKAGDILGPFGQEGQIMTVKVLEKTPAGKTPFEQVKEEIRREIVDREFNRVLDEKRKELRRKAVITIYYENLDKVSK